MAGLFDNIFTQNNGGGLFGGLSPEQLQQLQRQQPQAQPTQPDFGGRLGAGFLGFANARSPMQALGNLVQGLSTGQRSDPQGMQQTQLKATYQSLLGRGVPANEALAATLNPDIMKIVGAKYFDTQNKIQKTGTDPLSGQDSFGLFNPSKGTLTNLQVQGQQDTSGSNGFLAPGVGQVNHQLVGEDYLKQFSPEVQASVKNYIEGKTMPTGNARKGFTQAIKQIAQKYGSDTGIEADDTSFASRRTMRNDLSKGTPGSLGGQINFARTSINHLAEVAKAAADLQNADFGIAPLTQGVNMIRNLSTDQAAKVQSLKDAAMRYGQEITKFYAGSPGGEAERQHFMQALDGAKSPKELSAVIEQEMNLIPGRLSEIQNKIQSTLPGSEKEFPVHSKESLASLDEIKKQLNRMRTEGYGGTPYSEAGHASAQPQSSDGWTVVAPNIRIREKK